MHRRSTVLLFLVLAATSLAVTGLHGEEAVRFPEPPPRGEALRDEAGFVSEATAAKLRDVTRSLLDEFDTPVAIVIVPSIRAYGAESGWTVASWTRALFVEWASRVPDAPRVSNVVDEASAASTDAVETTAPLSFPRQAFAQRGILVVISGGDERVAVEKGIDWHSTPHTVRRIARAFAKPLERGEPSAAIEGGLTAVDALVRTGRVPLPRDWTATLVFSLAFVLVLVTVVAYLRQGSGGLLWRFWVAIFAAFGAAIHFLLRRGVDFGASLSGRATKGKDDGQLVIGRW